MNIDGSLICLEETSDAIQYFCYPTNAKAIGFEGCIMYCFIEPYSDMVFACNPESCTNRFVYPLAKSFEDFLGLILACGSANPIEQIVWMSREQFLQHLREEAQARTQEQQNLLDFIEKELAIFPIENPYDYVKLFKPPLMSGELNTVTNILKRWELSGKWSYAMDKNIINKSLPHTVEFV